MECVCHGSGASVLLIQTSFYRDILSGGNGGKWFSGIRSDGPSWKCFLLFADLIPEEIACYEYPLFRERKNRRGGVSVEGERFTDNSHGAKDEINRGTLMGKGGISDWL